MKANISFSEEYAVSEVVGGLLLVLIAVMVFSLIYVYVFPLPFPQQEPNVDLMGYVTDEGIAVIQHMGGESLSNYRIDIRDENGTLIDSTLYDDSEAPWCVGECKYLSTGGPLSSEEDILEVAVYTTLNDGEWMVFYGILSGRTIITYYSQDDML